MRTCRSSTGGLGISCAPPVVRYQLCHELKYLVAHNTLIEGPHSPITKYLEKLFVIIFLWVYAVVSETTKCNRVEMGKEPGLMKNKTKQRIILIPYLFRYFIPFSRLHPQNILSRKELYTKLLRNIMQNSIEEP